MTAPVPRTDLSAAFAAAAPRLAASGFPEGPALIGRYAMSVGEGISGLAPPDTWDAWTLAWMVERFVQDLGHACDAEGASFPGMLESALGARVRFVDPVSLDEGIPASVAAWPDPDAVSRILPALEVAYGEGSTVDRCGRTALRALLGLAEEVGVDGDEALRWGLSSWAGGRSGSDLIAVPGRPA